MKKSITAFLTLSAMAFSSLLSSCDSWVFDEQGDCSVHYRVPLTYTNIEGDPIFPSQVKSITLYIYDGEGNLVMKKRESGDVLKTPGYAMEVELAPGRYSMLVWGEGKAAYTDPVSFQIGGGDRPAAITELTATLPLSETPEGELYSDHDIVPLFHGYAADIELPDTYGTVTLPTISLTKDTNIFNISLENVEGTEIAPDALTVSITDDNASLNWDNSVKGQTAFSYKPWCVTYFSSEREQESRSEFSPVTGMLTELTTGRLTTGRKPVLVVHRKRDGKDIIRLDLVKYLLMVRGHYPAYHSDQEYLDKMDRYYISFFVDADLNWYTVGGININGWKVVPEQEMEL